MSSAGFLVFLGIACIQLSAFGSVEMDKFSDRAGAFGFSLIQNLQIPERPNLLVSPASLQIGLGMAYAGATGETADAMSRALGVSTVSRESALEEFSALQAALEQPDEGIKLKAANAVWIDLSVPLNEEFSSDVAEIFKAKFERLRFSDPESTRRINEWVSDKTEGKITRLLEGPPSPPMFLADAIYFHAPWANPFPKQANREQPFHLADGSTSEVTMMNQNGRFQYAKTPEYEVVFLPYAGDRFGMYCFLPDRGADALVAKLRESPWSELSTSLHPSQGSVALPKFTIQYDANLNQALIKLGMGIAFDGQRAQFTKMVDTPGRVFIGAVLHKTFLEVNEEGSTAAAATGVQMRTTAIIPSREEFNLVFDRPFLVVIADRERGTILFLGIIGDPKG
jgi:serine protease inhibitor